jgi:hypothetical protein
MRPIPLLLCSTHRDCAHPHQRTGTMDVTLRQAIAMGHESRASDRLASWNAADYWRLDGWAASSARVRANLVVLDDFVRSCRHHAYDGTGRRPRRSNGSMTWSSRASFPRAGPAGQRALAPLYLSDLRLDLKRRVGSWRHLWRDRDPALVVQPEIHGGWAVAAPERSPELACVEPSHHATGRVVGLRSRLRTASGALHRQLPTAPQHVC